MNIDIILMEYLQAHCRGRKHARPRLQIERDLALDSLPIKDMDRKFRDTYAGLPICTCEDGLFIPTTWQDVAEFKEYLRKKGMFEAAAIRTKRILMTWPNLVQPRGEQGRLGFEEAGG